MNAACGEQAIWRLCGGWAVFCAVSALESRSTEQILGDGVGTVEIADPPCGGGHSFIGLSITHQLFERGAKLSGVACLIEQILKDDG